MTDNKCAEVTERVLKTNEKEVTLLKDMATVMIPHLDELKTPKERRPILAAYAGHQKKVAESVANVKISHEEWNKIQLHAKVPGKFKPVPEIKYHRARVKASIMTKLLHFLERDKNLFKSCIRMV